MIPAIIATALLGLMLLAAANKWEIKQRHYVPWTIFICGLVFVGTLAAAKVMPPIIAVGLSIVIGGVSSIAAILYFFFRDPDRSPPNDPTKIVSPADGTIVYVKEITDGKFPFAVKGRNTIPLSEFSKEDLIPDRGLQIGIAMNYLNVHVNRSPIAGEVKMVEAVPGKFASLKHIASLLENERALMVFEGNGLKVGIVQIASRLVRRIVPYVEAGQSVDQGQRVGMIKFGSQVDLLVPDTGLSILVKEGDEVTAGESVLAVLE